MNVQAKPGTRCPKEGKPRQYIGDTPEEVPDSAYYRRLVADGSLIEEKVQRLKEQEKKEKTFSPVTSLEP